MNRVKQEIMAAAIDRIMIDEENGISRRYTFRESFSGFSGHFPGNPILPAIVQLLTVITLIEEHAGVEQQLILVEDAKFQNPVLPDQELLIRCHQRSIRGKLLHEARLTVDNRPAATFLIQMESRRDT